MEPYIKEKDGNIIGIIINSVDTAKDRIEELEIGYANLIPDKKFNRDFVKEVMVTPTTLFIDKDGKIIEIYTGSYGTGGDVKFIKNKVDKLKIKGVEKR